MKTIEKLQGFCRHNHIDLHETMEKGLDLLSLPSTKYSKSNNLTIIQLYAISKATNVPINDILTLKDDTTIINKYVLEMMDILGPRVAEEIRNIIGCHFSEEIEVMQRLLSVKYLKSYQNNNISIFESRTKELIKLTGNTVVSFCKKYNIKEHYIRRNMEKIDAESLINVTDELGINTDILFAIYDSPVLFFKGIYRFLSNEKRREVAQIILEYYKVYLNSRKG